MAAIHGDRDRRPFSGAFVLFAPSSRRVSTPPLLRANDPPHAPGGLPGRVLARHSAASERRTLSVPPTFRAGSLPRRMAAYTACSDTSKKLATSETSISLSTAARPCSIPSMDRSSSRSGQCSPSSSRRMWLRCAGSALCSSGYQSSGVLMIRPSSSVTTTCVSLTWAAMGRIETTVSIMVNSRSGAEVMPFANDLRLTLLDDLLDPAKLVRRVTPGSGDGYRINPEFGGHAFPLYVDVYRLVTVASRYGLSRKRGGIRFPAFSIKCILFYAI